MKPKNEEGAYQNCVAEGYIKEVTTINKEKAKSLLRNSDITIKSAESFAKTRRREMADCLCIVL